MNCLARGTRYSNTCSRSVELCGGCGPYRHLDAKSLAVRDTLAGNKDLQRHFAAGHQAWELGRKACSHADDGGAQRALGDRNGMYIANEHRKNPVTPIEQSTSENAMVGQTVAPSLPNHSMAGMTTSSGRRPPWDITQPDTVPVPTYRPRAAK